MPEGRWCDFCGRSERELAAGRAALEVDADGLWACGECRGRLVLPAVGEEAEEAPEELARLVGQSAGAICRTLNLPYEPPYEAVIDAASRIAYDEDRYMSAWWFVAQWLDGSTVWREEEGTAVAVVRPDGSVWVGGRGSD